VSIHRVGVNLNSIGIHPWDIKRTRKQSGWNAFTAHLSDTGETRTYPTVETSEQEVNRLGLLGKHLKQKWDSLSNAEREEWNAVGAKAERSVRAEDADSCSRRIFSEILSRVLTNPPPPLRLRNSASGLRRVRYRWGS
jgi:hypothetical protein